MLDPHQVAALCDQALSQAELIKWRALNASLPCRTTAHDLESVVRPLEKLIELLHKAQLRPPTPETIRG